MSEINDFLDGKQSSEIDSFLGPDAPKPAGAIRKVADLGLSVGKGVIAVPEAAVGLANLVTGGHAGKLAESAGVRFKDAKDVLSGWQSDDFKGKQQQFQQADGIIEKTGVALSNPSLIANTVAESLPLMGAGGVGARALLGAAPKIGAATAGAIGEGIAGAGSSGEQIRQESTDGLLSGKQAALAGASGAATAAFGAAGGKLAQKLGIGDIDTMLAGGTTRVAAGAAPKGAIRRMAEGAASEGLLEELPQSLSEQGFQNVALDRPVTQGMEDAGVMGVLTGGAMGAGAGAISRAAQPPTPPPTTPPTDGTTPPPAAPNLAPTDQAPAVPPAIEPSSLQSAPASQSALPGQTQQVSPSSTGSLPQNTLSNQSPNQSLDQAGSPLGSPDTKEAESLAAREAEVQQIVAASGGNPGALAKVAIASIQSGASGEIQLQQANEADQAAYEQATAEQDKQAAEQDSIDKPITSGPIAEAAMSDDDKRAIMFSNKTVADGGIQYPGTLDGDILNGQTRPYKRWEEAIRRVKMEGKDWRVAKVQDGFVARRKDANGPSTEIQPGDTGSTGVRSTDRPASVGVGATDGNGVGAQSGRSPDAVLDHADQLPKRVDAAPVATTRAQPTTLGKQTTASAGPGFTAKDVTRVQNAAPRADTAPAAQAVEAPAVVESNAAASEGVPNAGSVAVEGRGIKAGDWVKPTVGTDTRPRQVESVGDDGWVYTKSGDSFKPDQVEATTQPKPTPITGGTGVAGNWESPVKQVSQPQEQVTVKRSKNGYAEIKLNGKKHFVTPFDDHFVIRNPLGAIAKSDNEPLQFASEADAIAYAANTTKPQEQPNGPQAAQAQSQQTQPEAGPTASIPEPAAVAGVEGAGEGIEEPNFQAAKALLAQQKAATGNAVAEGHIRKKLRDLAAITPQDHAATVMALDTAATRLGMGEGKLKGLEFAPATKPVSDTQTADAPAKPDTQRITTDKAEIRPYRKPDGSVGYEAVPIVDAPSSLETVSSESEAKTETKPPQAPANTAPVATESVAKPDAKAALSEREKAAKAKMFNALGKLATLAGKNTRMNWTQEEEQQLLPIVIELFDGAMELGAVTFKQAVAYVREFISSNLDSETADAIPFDTLQGAYISVAGRHKDKPVTSKKEVVSFESLDELVNSTDKADTSIEDKPNEPTAGNQPDTSGPSVQDEQPGELQPDAGTVRRGNAKSNTGNASRGTDKNAPPDYVPAAGGLTREGSWYETAKRNIDLIELAIKIDSENRPATPDEQAKLSKYVGFGASAIRNELFPVPPAYAKAQEPNRLIWPQYVRNDRFKPLAERIEALPREWQQSILQSSQYAHYTSEGIIRSVWGALERMGFKGGQVFEPGMGIGSFAMLMPDAIRAESRYTGVEFDAPTALIAKLLSPQQNMLHGDFIKGRYPKNFFDVNVGNPPFSQTKIFGDPEYAKKGFMLHDFFFAKGIDLVRPGGIQVFVTSKGTMDKQTDKARKYLSERADLLGAIRLPSTAFEDNAGTSVVTDVIFLRKRLPGEAPAGEAWANTATVETKDGPVVVNEYFAKHPEMVLGQQRISGNVDDQGRRINSNGMGGEKYTVVSYDTTPAELEAKFAKAIEKLPEGAYSEKQGKTEKAKDARVDFDPSVKREGVVYLAKDGTLMRVAEGVGVPLENTTKLNDKDQAWFKSYVGLRDLVQEARFAQLNEKAWEAALAKLNKAYDKFVKEHGHILDYRVMTRKSTDEEGNVVETESRIPKNRRLLREDYDQALVTSLETITEDGSIVKSPFLKGRTIGKPVSREVKSIGDALAVSLDETGHFDLADVGKRLKLDEEATIEALGNQIFKTPDGDWQLTDEYLSGDVVAKLEEAEAAARINPDLKRNVEALKEAQPEKLGPAQISAKLGASWIPESHVNEFAREIDSGVVTFDPRTETWQVDGGNKQTGRRAGAEYGTARRSPSELLEAILNSRSIKITQTIDKKTVPDQEATTAANEMAKKIKDKFKGWVWTDTDRATELVESYNKNFNNIAPRKFDGSHLTLPGVSLRYKLHPHQLRAIWRMIQTGNTYLAHAVGAGKTIEMIAGGMEQKRLGLIKKPIYVVPNHMLEQFSNEFMELYPLANIMVADDENFSPERRKAFIASATLNSPDAIVITHDAFQRIGVKEESVAPIRDEILADLEIELSETAKGNDTRVRRGQLEQQIEAVKQRFDRIVGAGAKDSTIKFEDMGVDFVFADEAHVFRKLDFHTAQQIKGIDPNGSKRALDMYVKTRILEKKKPGRSMVFASGTPVTNTMGELYTIMRFFAGAELDKSGISTFDAWARQFGEVAPALEPNAAGKYELIERFAKFDNVPELMSRVRQFMDVLTSDNLGALVKRPDIKGGKPNLNIIPTNSDLTDYMKGELARRIDISRAWKPSKDEPHNPDPIVAIITDGRFAAIDPRFFGGKLAEGDKSIITEMGDKVAASYHATKNDVYLDKDGKEEKIKGSTQIVFYNLGFGEQSQRSRGFNSRAAFTKRLTDGGIPRAEIAWFDDANSDAKKEAVFKAMRNGSIKVLIGSAKKMGTGVNVQKRLAVLHYQDPPWFPADVEQPHGRILRQGNQNEEIAIEWYTTKGTYQSTMWQMVGRKQRFIDQAFTGDKTLRSMDDLGEASLFEQAAAVASGDPRAIQLAGLKQDVERFTRLQAAHANEQMNVRSALNSATWQIESGQKSIKTLEKAFKAIGEKYFAFTAGRVNGRDYTKPGEFGQAIKDEFNRLAADSVMGELVKDKQIASLGTAIKVTMDAYIGKGNKPDGTFDFYVEFGGSAYQLGNTAAMGADVDAVGLARRIFNKINEVDSDLQRARRSLAANETDAIKLRKKMGAPFEYQQEMAEKYGELKRLEAELEAEGKATPAAKSALAIKADGTANGEAPEVSTNLKQTGSPEGNAFDVLFSTRTSAPEKQLPLQQIERLVQSALRGVKNAPTVRVVANPEAIGLRTPVDTVPSGVTLANGDIYVFQSGVGSALDVDMVVFHELFHKGLQNVMPRSDYVAAMQDIAKIDAKVRQYASEWSDSNAGKDQLKELAKKYSGKELADQYEALATEEGLASIAEDLKAKREMGSKDMRVRRLVAWLAKMADKIGMTRLADSLRAMSYSEAEKFVIATIGRAGGSTGGSVKFSASDAKQTDTAAFKKWFASSKVVDADGKPLVVYHGTATDLVDNAFNENLAKSEGGAFYFSNSPLMKNKADNANEYAAGRAGDSQQVIPVYLNMRNPLVAGFTEPMPEGDAAIGKWLDRMDKFNRSIDYTKERYYQRAIREARANGNDGVIIRNVEDVPNDAGRRFTNETDVYIVFNPTQIKSATGNNGDFDGTNPDIRFRAADTLNAAANNVRNVKLPAGYLVGDLINGAPGKLNWWHRSVGTMYNLAQRSTPFKRVFDSVQTFINDVSYYATEAADLAPNILPKLETWKDIAKSPLSAADTKAISAPIFEGTLIWARDESGKPVKVATLEAQAAELATDQKAKRLLRGGHVSENVLKMWQGLPVDQFETIINGKYERDMLKAGVVWTDAELKSIFNLTDKQIPLYREFRKATDKSLTNLAIADMLRFGGEDVMPIREQVLASKDVSEAAETLRDYLLSLTDIDPDRADVLTDTADKMIEKGDRAKDLIDRGYAPLSRFGQYTLDVVHDGERVYFSMFESKWEAARMNRQMQAEYPNAQITQGTVSEQSYKMFAGVSPETLELFGDMLGLEAQGDDASAKAFQEYLKLAKSSRSAMKRLIHRKGIAGFNEDAGRVLAGFVYSNARQTASSLHMGEMTNAANDISQTQGELKDAAVKLVDYIKNPQEEAQKLRGLLFAQYIGGSVASAMVNMTQPLTMTFPWLSQYGGVASAAKQMTAAMKDSGKKLTGDAKLDAALHRAEEDGTVSPQEVHQLLQQSMGKGALQSGDGTTAGNAMATANNTLSRFSLGWGKLFSVAEQFNRRVTFIAAYRTAVTQGMADPDAFARKAVAETQGVYNKGNKPAWARGALGSTLFTFKQYSIAYVEMLSRMAKAGKPGSKERAQGQKAALLALGVLFLMSGAGGMPGADDLDDLISGILQSMGYNFDSKARRKEFFVSLFGEGGAQFVEHGVSGLPGVPIDVSGRMGLGNLIPGTGLFTKKTDHTRDVAELAGPAGDLAKRTFEAAGKLIKGDAVGSAVSVSPKAFQNLHQAYDMANMGMYRDASGKKVVDTDGYDAIAKAIGFQPTDVKRIQDASIEVQRMIGLNKMRESEIADKWALGMFEKNPAKVEDARNDLKTWNADNPSSPIRINFGQIIKRVQKMNETKTQRIAKTAPREIRETVRRELATQ